MKTGPGGVNDASTSPPGHLGRAQRGLVAPGEDPDALETRTVVADLLYAVVAIVVFALLVLTVRGLDRL